VGAHGCKMPVSEKDPALPEPLALVHEGLWCGCPTPDRM
jgi:hypothetical protein